MVDRNIPLSDLAKTNAIALQEKLKELGYYDHPIDGLIGKNTSHAWAEWKEDNFLGRHTEIGPASWELLERQSGKAIDWSNFSCPISEFFTVGEVTNRQRQRIPTDPNIRANILRLAAELDRIRDDWGSAILVTSWYRPPAINRAVGGAKNSQHLTGKAADIRPAQEDVLAFQFWLDKRWDKALGYGAKKGFVHIDLRPGRIRWHY
jgi:putative chitinase